MREVAAALTGQCPDHDDGDTYKPHDRFRLEADQGIHLSI